MDEKAEEFDWSVAGWEGSRRAQIRRWMSLTLRERLEMLEGMARFARHMESIHRKRPAGEATAGGRAN